MFDRTPSLPWLLLRKGRQIQPDLTKANILKLKQWKFLLVFWRENRQVYPLTFFSRERSGRLCTAAAAAAGGECLFWFGLV